MLRKFIVVITFSLVFGSFIGTGKAVMAQTGGGKVSLVALEEISDLIMSPGCAYKFTLTNCPSVQAVELRDLIRGKLLAGETKEQIIQYLLDLYGSRILAAPEKRGFFLLAWWVPYFAIADGALIIAVIIIFWRKRAKRSRPSGLTETDQERLRLYEEKIEDEMKKMDL